MEFGAREMMIALGALVALAIMLDVIRRIRNARYEKIHMPRRKQPIFDDNEEFDEFGSELPSGGARVVSYRDDEDIEEAGKTVRERAEANKPKLSIPIAEPEQSSLNLDEPAERQSGPQAEDQAPCAPGRWLGSRRAWRRSRRRLLSSRKPYRSRSAGARCVRSPTSRLLR